MTSHLSHGFTLLLTPLRPALCASQANGVEVLVRLQAPDAPASEKPRPPQAVALVIDRSGSMEGRPIEEARRCAEFAVSRMRPIDSVALVQFDDVAERLWPATPLAEGSELRAAIGRIDARGNTDLYGGWLEGAESLEGVPGNGLKRVVLLSDGCANHGLTDTQRIAHQCARWAEQGVTTSTYGLGNDFNEDLMLAMARAGGGNHYYGESADDLMEPFQQELDLLANLALRRVDLHATVPKGMNIDVLNDLRSSGAGWRLPDLAWGAEAWAVLRITVPADEVPPIGGVLSLLTVEVTGDRLDAGLTDVGPMSLQMPVLHPAEADTQPEDDLVRRRLTELAAAEVLTQMRGAAHLGRWDEADRMLGQALERFGGNDWVNDILQAMTVLARSRSRERVTKEAMYASAKLSSRLAAKEETDVRFSQSGTPAFLRRKALQGKKDL